ncbi:MAG: peptidyl-prolyl cis-trans isomerase [Cenarchaeum symbiont of Oopsacas minuta]|nr:peptidyl-prolyl cis-trans isomerase [Cenarchaeum symbiont of Oopsacas minuta]
MAIAIPTHVIAQSEDQVAIIETKSGNFVIELFPDIAPSHVNNFITLSNDGYYDGTVFHRVIKDFMIQGGDPNTKDPNIINLWGTGGPGYSIDEEFNDISHERGIVSMARSSDPNSAGSQFFIVHDDASFLDGQYTVFGRISGDESFVTLDKIANMETVSGDRPKNWQDTEIISITFVDKEITSTRNNFDENMNDEMMMDDEKEDGGGCLIATATFGSEMAPQVQNLREIRDNTVLETESGRMFMMGFNHIYYAFSPTVADLERKDPVVREIVQTTITPMMTSLSILKDLEINSEAEMISYGVLIILINILMYAGAPLVTLYILKRQLSRMIQNKKNSNCLEF